MLVKAITHIRAWFFTSLLAAIMVVVPSVSAFSAHECCGAQSLVAPVQTASQDVANGHQHHLRAARDHSSAITAHDHQRMSVDCEAACCSAVVAGTLDNADNGEADIWYGSPVFVTVDTSPLSTILQHILPPPRLLP